MCFLNIILNLNMYEDQGFKFGLIIILPLEKSLSGWCQLAYWEQSQRVGRLFPVENPAVNIFAEQTRGDGLCLTTLAMQRLSATPDVVLKARQKIGLGMVEYI